MLDKVTELSCVYKHSDVNFRIMFQDEAGFGRINVPRACWCDASIRPSVPCHRVREYTYTYGAADPINGDFFSIVMKGCDTAGMNLFLSELSKAYQDSYILLPCDNASWHKSNGLIVPNNIELFPLLPYTPELNPIEMIWDELREKFFKNELFKTLKHVTDRLCEGLLHLHQNKYIVKSITGWNWIVSMFLKTN